MPLCLYMEPCHTLLMKGIHHLGRVCEHVLRLLGPFCRQAGALIINPVQTLSNGTRKACTSQYKVLAMIDHFARSHELKCACTEKKMVGQEKVGQVASAWLHFRCDSCRLSVTNQMENKLSLVDKTCASDWHMHKEAGQLGSYIAGLSQFLYVAQSLLVYCSGLSVGYMQSVNQSIAFHVYTRGSHLHCVVVDRTRKHDKHKTIVHITFFEIFVQVDFILLLVPNELTFSVDNLSISFTTGACWFLILIILAIVLVVVCTLGIISWWIGDIVIFANNNRLSGDGCMLRPI